MNHTAVAINGHTYEIVVQRVGEEIEARILSVDGAPVDGTPRAVYAPQDNRGGPPDWMIVDRHSYELLFDRDLRWVQAYSGRHAVEVRDLNAAVARPASGDGRVKAPIPGLIARLLVEPEQVVEPGAPLLILEAMKMENEIQAPRGGRVAHVNVQPGQTVTLGELLIEIE
jgi:biotin carboxyl carrier protein